MKAILMALVMAFALTVPAFANDHATSEMTPPPAVEKAAPVKAEKAHATVEKKAKKAHHKAKKEKKAPKAAKAKHHGKHHEDMKAEHGAHGEELKVGPVPKTNE